MSTDLVPIVDATEIERSADPAQYVMQTLERAKIWLAHTLEHGDIEQIIELKSQAEAIRIYTMSKQLGKDAELAAAEIVRRAERGLAIAVRRGQEAGVIAKRGSIGGHGAAGVAGGVPGSTRNGDLDRPGRHFANNAEMTDSYCVADNTSTEEFEEVIAEARSEGNLSRANVVRKVKKEEKPVTTPVRTQIATAAGQRRALTGACTTLSGVALGLRQCEDLHPDITSEEAAQWVGDLSEARLAIERVIKRLKERTNNGA